MLHRLLAHGAEREAADSYGWRPLHLGTRYSRCDVVAALLEAGVDGHARTADLDARTPLEVAEEAGKMGRVSDEVSWPVRARDHLSSD